MIWWEKNAIWYLWSAFFSSVVQNIFHEQDVVSCYCPGPGVSQVQSNFHVSKYISLHSSSSPHRHIPWAQLLQLSTQLTLGHFVTMRWCGRRRRHPGRSRYGKQTCERCVTLLAARNGDYNTQKHQLSSSPCWNHFLAFSQLKNLLNHGTNINVSWLPEIWILVHRDGWF